MSYKILIPTAGTGSRLIELTQNINKSLVTVANKPVLSFLIEQFPEDSEFVIALGHKGELVREFLSLAYPKRIFHFSDVTPFEGPNSGLGLSILTCKKYLQEPFIFCSCDTIVEEKIHPPDKNWMGYTTSINNITSYRTLHIIQKNNIVDNIYEKNYQCNNIVAYIGLSGINCYKKFWSSMESGGNEAVTKGEVYGMRSLLNEDIYGIPFTWWDTGNKKALKKTRKKYNIHNSPNILEKPNEAIWFVNKNVIKFSSDEKFIQNRVKRSEYLSEFCPGITGSTTHMYKYQKIDGKVFSEIVTLPLFNFFLNKSKQFWMEKNLSVDEKVSFKKVCLSFYREKTIQRIGQFYRSFKKIDGTESINGISMPTLYYLLEKLDWNWISDGLPGRFHGDFHFENILWSEETKKLTFLDWRQEFGGSLTVGDIYYDMAKLLHGLIVCHELISHNFYDVTWEEKEIKFNLLRRQILVECELYYEKWIIEQKYDLHKIKILTALIYLNIAALHHYPYCLLLYALGKQMLYMEMKK